ncbi:MAG: ATPase, partial [Sphaerospermopsis sp. SIO1G2]|nr:ATPase [Sphaerospermopsis sp. SIO1G2]
MKEIDNILQYMDNVIFDHTGENLTPVEEAIIKGVWNGKKYLQIAESFNHCSESHIKKEAAKLWKKLGEALGENLNRNNFRSKLEKKHRISQRDNVGDCLLQIDNINIGGQFIQSTNYKPNNSNSPNSQNQTPKIDLTKAPELNYKYGRDSEITTLKNWILEKQTRL